MATIGSLKWWTNCCLFGSHVCIQMKGRKNMEINMVIIISTTAKDPIDCECRQILKLNLKTISPLLLKYCIFTCRDWRDVWRCSMLGRTICFRLSSLFLFHHGAISVLCDFWFVVFISGKQCLNNWNLNQTPNTLYNLYQI